MAKARRKPGPRPMPAKQRKTKQLHVMLTEAEYASVERAAGGRDLSGWARKTLLDAIMGVAKGE